MIKSNYNPSLLVLLDELTKTVAGTRDEFNYDEKQLHLILFEIQSDGINTDKLNEYTKFLDKLLTILKLIDKEILFRCTMKNIQYKSKLL